VPLTCGFTARINVTTSSHDSVLTWAVPST
jgi:hypothetical protein